MHTYGGRDVIEWIIIAILYVCGAITYGVAFYEVARNIKSKPDILGLVLWPGVPIIALGIVLWRRLTRRETLKS